MVPWSDVLTAVRFGHVCPQAAFFHYTQPLFQSEDCLFINVFVPYEVLKYTSGFCIRDEGVIGVCAPHKNI